MIKLKDLILEIVTPAVILGCVKPDGSIISVTSQYQLEKHPASMRSDHKWRYYPEIQQLYWWGKPDDETHQNVKDYLYDKGFPVKRIYFSSNNNLE